ncbi:SEC14-like protein 2 [Uloborus diversus]|uniref:SEC14-like protein 2 n=1 Tax=Uloborus diversus TaxID=327109 RepID=UPI0024094CDB|nr:SEC14-like protein 2 [Uloborus diversus]
MAETKMMSPEEEKAVKELKERLQGTVDEDYGDDLLFYRFLKARDFNLNAAESMLRKHLEWRKEKNIDEFMKTYTPPEILAKYFLLTDLGYDKDGCLVRYWPIGNVDFKGFFKCFKFSDLEKFFIYTHESESKKLEEQSKKHGKRIYQVAYIYNIEGITFAKATDKKVIDTFITISNAFYANYPERMKCSVVINTSPYFALFFSVIKKFIPSTTLSKINVFSSDEFKEFLLKEIDADQLPAFLGGTRTDPDGNPRCNSFVVHGGLIPEKHYIHKSKRSLANMPGVKEITLSRASFHEEPVEVREGQSLLEWEFETKSRDIGFGLFYQDISSGEEKMVELVPIQRIDTDEYSESGVFKCEKEGKYVILFDNTYSWLRPKEIFFKISVISPEDHAKNFNCDISENGH